MERARTGVTLIGERVLHHWTDTGHHDVLKNLTLALSGFSRNEADSDLPRLLYELLWIVLQTKLTRQEVLALLKDAEMTTHPKACDLLTDLLWVIGNEVETSERGHERHTSKEWRNLSQLVKAVADEKLVSLLNLKASLEFDLLHDAGLAPEPQVLAKKMVRINTKTLYTQTKYNLLREETEGFSKVLSLLHTGVTKHQLEATSTDLLALIGYFDLDANRVLDLVLDAYEMHPRNDCFAQLLGNFKRDSLPHIMGFKFQFYKREPPVVEDITTPRSLYRLAATLLNKKLLELETLMPHLAPSRDEIVKAAVEHEKDMLKQARSFGQISLAAKKDSNKTNTEEEAAAAAAEKVQRDRDHNQVYGVIIGLLEIGALERAFEMISWFQKQGVNPLTFKPLTTELCAVVKVMIADVFYRRYPNVELAGLLQYLIQRLQSWASVDLIVLSELLTKMGSCLSLEDISVSQLEAQAGGPHLWYEPTDPKFQNRRAIPRLRDALIKRNLALPLCILICQMRSRIEFHEDRELPHLKLLGRVYDTCQLTLSQLLQFLSGVIDPLVYRKMLPSITSLVREYNVPVELAMALCRPAMRSDDPLLQTAPRGVHASGGGNTAASGTPSNRTTAEKSWYMYNPDFLEDVKHALCCDDEPESNRFTGLTREMYVTFWGLTLYDIHIPFQQYESEILRLRNSVSGASNSSLSASERKKLKEKSAQMIDVLTTEQKDQVAHRKRVYERLEDMKSKFFKAEPPERLTAIDELLQKCVIPRALLSPEDALFVAKFMERIHMLATPEFSTLQYIHKNGATYDDEAVHGKIGMSLDLNDDTKRIGHRQFKVAYARWHHQCELVYTTALSSGEYMQIPDRHLESMSDRHLHLHRVAVGQVMGALMTAGMPMMAVNLHASVGVIEYKLTALEGVKEIVEDRESMIQGHNMAVVVAATTATID
ncbi:THO complex subunit 2 [Phytophthora boehmeriae]|uniref:THO complex subunit 2 n=1 Tax=Phytophthora boehmeriae TaxID=109152 RepID=A0A8T1WRU2_9STRA|nr:THO complex subunit 2 [Phytophthora boehmeriae]